METEVELYESEVLWPEAHHDVPASAPPGSSSVAPSRAAAPRISKNHRPCSASSRPVDIPRAARSRRRGSVDQYDEEDEDGGRRGGMMVPPHVMVSRRRPEAEGTVAFSLRSGPGRADLSHLRNFVLRMTGFIEG